MLLVVVFGFWLFLYDVFWFHPDFALLFPQVPWKPLRVVHAGLRVYSSYSNPTFDANPCFSYIFSTVIVC
jgi:hypothetical protein